MIISNHSAFCHFLWFSCRSRSSVCHSSLSRCHFKYMQIIQLLSVADSLEFSIEQLLLFASVSSEIVLISAFRVTTHSNSVVFKEFSSFESFLLFSDGTLQVSFSWSCTLPKNQGRTQRWWAPWAPSPPPPFSEIWVCYAILAPEGKNQRENGEKWKNLLNFNRFHKLLLKNFLKCRGAPPPDPRMVLQFFISSPPPTQSLGTLLFIIYIPIELKSVPLKFYFTKNTNTKCLFNIYTYSTNKFYFTK